MTSYRKVKAGVPSAYFDIEAAGLRWLSVPAGPPVVRVRDVATDHLELERIVPGRPGDDDHRRFGMQLAHLHGTEARAFGCPPDGVDRREGFIADLPLPYGDWGAFGPFYAEARIRPYLDLLEAAGGLPESVHTTFESLQAALRDSDPAVVGPASTPRRIHGDLWSGNVVWGRRDTDDGSRLGGWLIDPAAHGGHPETDLAMLALFGQPGLEMILAGYQSVAPLPAGWRGRIPLHQVHPLLVHAVLFGGGYLAQAHSAARAALAAV